MKRIAIALVVLSASCAAVAPRSNPAPPPRIKPVSSKEHETERVMGSLLAGILQSGYGAYEDPKLDAYVSRVGARVARHSERTDLTWHFVVSDDPAIGARGIPGGWVLVSKTVLPFLSNEAELAAVLAHEIAHVSLSHGSEQWAATQAPSDPDASERALDLDRDQERQADALGTEYLARAGYDPHAMQTALQALVRAADFQCRRAAPACDAQANDETDPHPAIDARVARVALVAGTRHGELGARRYLRAIDELELTTPAPELRGRRFLISGSLSFEFPADAQPKLEGRSVVGHSRGRELQILPLHSGKWVELIENTLKSERFVTRGVLGHTAVIGNVGSGDSRGYAALLDVPPHAYLLSVSGDDTSSRELMDALLADVRFEAQAPDASKRLRVVDVTRAVRLDALVRSRCPETALDLASALNGVDERAVLPRGRALKCVSER